MCCSLSRFRSDSLDPGYETLTNKGPRRGGPAPPPPPPPAGDVTAPVTSRSYGPRSYPPDSGRYGGGGYGGREPGYESLADLRDPDYESVITGAGRKKNKAVIERERIPVPSGGGADPECLSRTVIFFHPRSNKN
jgi:hypothetical protein